VSVVAFSIAVSGFQLCRVGGGVRFQILGSVTVDGREVPVTAGRDRVLLGVLLLHANQPMTSDQLIDAVWPGRPPRDARNQEAARPTWRAALELLRLIDHPDAAKVQAKLYGLG
jgi:DNA-binding response OmpR family regulator